MEPELQQYTDTNLCVSVQQEYMSHDNAADLFNYLIKNAKFKHGYYTAKGTVSKKRNKVVYGSIPAYKAIFRGVEISERVIHWNTQPRLRELAERLTAHTGQEYHVCVIQMYNTGEVGIKPHRDKEMKPGTIIASLSLGAERTMRFEHRSGKVVDIPLPHGSLCLIHPPTNDVWTHSIPTDATTTPRLSLIFRNCEGM